MNYVLILGAKSDIAKEVSKIYANNNYNLYLAGRNISSIEDFSKDITIRNNVNVILKEFDMINFSSHEEFYNNLSPKPIGVVLVAGYMADQKECESDFQKSLNTINVNYTGAVSILNIVSNAMEKNKEGFIVGISSVAGDRGRKSNYIYGSSKAAFTAYLSGLRNRLHEANVKVLTVKPGFVKTQMTKHLDLPPKLTALPEKVASAIFKAQQKGKNILYTKGIWRLIMLIIRNIPEFIFKKLSI